jgi:hypothetical protein
MKNKVEYGLEGAFKVDLYSGGKFCSTTDWFSNFITPTGLMYPSGYAFADCFRYLSIGTSSTPHVGSTALGNFGTTGLTAPIDYIHSSDGVNQRAQYIGWQGYATGTTNSSCGTTLTETGPRFYRAWNIPTGREEIYVQEDSADGLTISEFMVSPDTNGDTNDNRGRYAFSRVVRNLFIPNGYRAIISYQLKISVQNTTATHMPSNSFDITNADIDNDAEIVTRWQNLEALYKQVYFGLRCVDNYGLTYIPKYGDGMEPSSRNIGNMIWYLSPDNSQFDVNKLGGAQTNVTKAYQADGLFDYVGSPNIPLDFSNVTSVTLDENTTPAQSTLEPLYATTTPTISEKIPSSDGNYLSNIRIGSSDDPLLLPQLENYGVADPTPEGFNYQQTQGDSILARTISYATPGTGMFDEAVTNFGKRAVFASNTSRLPFSNAGKNDVTTRKKTLTRKSVFPPVVSLGKNTPFGSMVYAYAANRDEAGNHVYWPMIDCLFKDTSGMYLMPHYRYVSGIHLTERGTGVLDCSLYLSGSGQSGNIVKFVPRKTFQGGYHQGMVHWVSGAETDDAAGFSGFYASGSLNLSASGVTGLTIGGTFYPSGWGAVYGVVVDKAFYEAQEDMGIYPRTTGNLTAPLAADTGNLYWPYAKEPFGLKIYGSGLKFWTPELGTTVISDNAGFYGKNQILKDIYWQPQKTDYTNALINTATYTGNITGSTGFFLTTGRFFGEKVSNWWTGVVNNTTTNFALTGYIVSAARNTTNQLKASSWVDAGGQMPTDKFAFNPTYTSHTIGAVTVKRLASLFTTETERGYPTATGAPFLVNDSINVFFTGFTGSTAGVFPRNGLYLTYVSGATANDAYLYSYLSGVPSLTNFRPPTGFPLHGEYDGSDGRRLAVNFAPATADLDQNTYTAVSGGAYPALSMDNGLEVYLDISWSSPCGPNVQGGTCNEPT